MVDLLPMYMNDTQARYLLIAMAASLVGCIAFFIGLVNAGYKGVDRKIEEEEPIY